MMVARVEIEVMMFTAMLGVVVRVEIEQVVVVVVLVAVVLMVVGEEW